MHQHTAAMEEAVEVGSLAVTEEVAEAAAAMVEEVAVVDVKA